MLENKLLISSASILDNGNSYFFSFICFFTSFLSFFFISLLSLHFYISFFSSSTQVLCFFLFFILLYPLVCLFLQLYNIYIVSIPPFSFCEPPPHSLHLHFILILNFYSVQHIKNLFLQEFHLNLSIIKRFMNLSI